MNERIIGIVHCQGENTRQQVLLNSAFEGTIPNDPLEEMRLHVPDAPIEEKAGAR
jgi:hypothetical protein